MHQCRFERNSATENTISFMYALASITESYFTRNTASSRTKNIFMGFSTVGIEETTFRSTPVLSPESYVESDDTQGAFLFIIIDVVLTVSKCKFFDGTALEGGALYLSGASQIALGDSDFRNNVARLSGGAFYGAAFTSILINGLTKFGNNRALGLGDDVFVANSENELKFDNFEIYNSYATTSVYVDTATLVMNGGYIHDIENPNSDKGAAIQCYNCKAVHITNTKFEDLLSG